MNAAEFDRTFKLPFDEAVAWFRAKANVPTEHWAELEGAAHAKMFTSAGATHAELLSDLRKMTDAAVAGKMDIREFRKQFKPLVGKYGWQLKGGGPGWRSDLIWRTNIQAEHTAGFIGASEELRAKIEMPTAQMGILVNLATVSC